MQVQIKGATVEIRVQTITLQPEETGNMYGFHCLGCGNFHQKIGGLVSKVYPIYEPTDQVPVISKCRNCGREYNFQTHDGYDTKQIKIVLHPTESMNYFYCYKGKDKILEYTPMYVRSHVDNQYKTAPFTSNCINPTCDMVYLFSDIV
jgi:hypothetical protein